MLLGKKVGMTQVYDEKERLLPVTVIQAGPCVVMQVKTVEADGYNAVQLGFDDVKASRSTKAAIAHAEKAKTTPKKFVREMRLIGDAKAEVNPGDAVTVTTFAETKFVDVIGTSKGKGFAGPMKRYHFGGMPGSHGTERKHRSPGSAAALAATGVDVAALHGRAPIIRRTPATCSLASRSEALCWPIAAVRRFRSAPTRLPS